MSKEFFSGKFCAVTSASAGALSRARERPERRAGATGKRSHSKMGVWVGIESAGAGGTTCRMGVKGRKEKEERSTGNVQHSTLNRRAAVLSAARVRDWDADADLAAGNASSRANQICCCGPDREREPARSGGSTVGA